MILGKSGMYSVTILGKSGLHISPNTSTGKTVSAWCLLKQARFRMVANAMWALCFSILLATTLGCLISSKMCSMMCTLGTLMFWGRVINTSAISTMWSLLVIIISLKNMIAGLVPAILTVSRNSLLSMGLFSTKVLNILEGLCDVSELFHNLGPDCWSHWHKFAIGSEHMVGGVRSQALEVILLLLEAGDLHPLLTRDGLGVFKQEVLHHSRCDDGGQGGVSLTHLLQCQNLPGAGHHLLSVESQQVLLVLSLVDDGMQLEVCHVRSTTEETGHPNLSVGSVASSNQAVLVASGGNEETPLGALGDVPGSHQLEDLLSLAHVRLDQCPLSLADEVGRDLSDLVHVLADTVNALLHHGPEGWEVTLGHRVGTWDGVGKLGGSWQLNLDG